MTGTGLEVANLTKVYSTPGGASVTALRGVSLAIASGSVMALMGPSGSGKSTLLHLMGGMDRPDRGTIVVDGVGDLTQMRSADLVQYRRTVGFVFQSFALLPALTARDNVMLPVIPYKVPDAAERAEALLESVGLGGREGALPSQLSGGQRQRVAIARALMGQPRLLVADEPTGNLDSKTGDEILELLFDIREQRGVTVVIATHDSRVAGRTDRMLELIDGRIVSD